MLKGLNVLAAFVKRDFHIAASYKFNFVFQLTAGFFIVAAFYFISQMIDSDASRKMISRFSTDYFSFVLIGVAAAGFLQTGLTGFADRLRTGMTEGSLEMTFSCPIQPIWVLVLPCIWAFIFEALKAATIVLFGVLVFGAMLGNANYAACAVVLLLTMTSYSVFGILSASMIMILKRGDVVNMAFGAASSLIAGAYFPVALLPSWLGAIAKILPMTYVYDALRKTLLLGQPLSGITHELLVLGIFSLVGLPIAIFVADLAIKKTKRDGTLGVF